MDRIKKTISKNKKLIRNIIIVTSVSFLLSMILLYYWEKESLIGVHILLITIYCMCIGFTMWIINIEQPDIALKRLVWYSLLPSLKIIVLTIVSVLVFVLLSLIQQFVSSDVVSPIIMALMTGLVASYLVTLIAELSENYNNNSTRMLVMDDYLITVSRYENSVGQEKKIIEEHIREQQYEPFSLEGIFDEPSGEENEYAFFEYMKKYIADWDGAYCQAISNVMRKKTNILVETMHNHSNLLYANELDCLQEIIASVEACKTIAKITYEDELGVWQKQYIRKNGIEDSNPIDMFLFRKGLEDMNDIIVEGLYHRMLSDLTQLEMEDRKSVVLSIITFDMNMKKLGKSIKYEKKLYYKEMRNKLKNLKY